MFKILNSSRCKQSSPLLLAVMLVVVPYTAISQPSQSPEQEFFYSQVRENYFRPEPYELQLPNGNIVWFVASRNESGEHEVIGIAELRRSGNRGIASVPELRDAPATTIFHALAANVASTPSFLRGTKCQTAEERPRGWAREQILQAPPPVSGGGDTGGSGRLMCPEDDWTYVGFVNDINSKGYLLSFTSKDDGPQNKPEHWKFSAWGAPELRGGVADATAFYFSVLYCQQRSSEDSLFGPPEVRVFRYAGGSLHESAQGMLGEPGDQFTYMTPPGAIGEPYEYRVYISPAIDMDMFYIGATWQKPFGTLLPPP